jgi:hypothetical protein
LNKDSLNQKLNRMSKVAKQRKLAKISRGFWCHIDYEKAVRAAGRAYAGKSTGQNHNQSTVSNPLPRVKDLLMKKPKVLPQPLQFNWALRLEYIMRLGTGNVGIIGGSTDAGKTILLLDFIMRNMDNFRIRCINWEMDEGELYERLLLLEKCYGVSADSFYDKVEFLSWYCTADDPASMAGLLHLIDPDKVNIVDYLTANEDFFKIGGPLERIHNKLKKGVCLVALQKDSGVELPYGKGQTQKVARVALTLDLAPDKGPDCTHLRFTKAKGRVNKNIKPVGVDIFFDILEGAKLILREALYLGKPIPFDQDGIK